MCNSYIDLHQENRDLPICYVLKVIVTQKCYDVIFDPLNDNDGVFLIWLHILIPYFSIPRTRLGKMCHKF